MSKVELTYVNDVLEPKVEPPKTLAEQQLDALLDTLKLLRSQNVAGKPNASPATWVLANNAIAAVESGKVPS